MRVAIAHVAMAYAAGAKSKISRTQRATSWQTWWGRLKRMLGYQDELVAQAQL